MRPVCARSAHQHPHAAWGAMIHEAAACGRLRPTRAPGEVAPRLSGRGASRQRGPRRGQQGRRGRPQQGQGAPPPQGRPQPSQGGRAGTLAAVARRATAPTSTPTEPRHRRAAARHCLGGCREPRRGRARNSGPAPRLQAGPEFRSRAGPGTGPDQLRYFWRPRAPPHITAVALARAAGRPRPAGAPPGARGGRAAANATPGGAPGDWRGRNGTTPRNLTCEAAPPHGPSTGLPGRTVGTAGVGAAHQGGGYYYT